MRRREGRRGAGGLDSRARCGKRAGPNAVATGPAETVHSCHSTQAALPHLRRTAPGCSRWERGSSSAQLSSAQQSKFQLNSMPVERAQEVQHCPQQARGRQAAQPGTAQAQTRANCGSHWPGSEEAGHGPAAAALGGLHVSHIDLVHIGPLLAVNLDVHKQLVPAALEGIRGAALSRPERAVLCAGAGTRCWERQCPPTARTAATNPLSSSSDRLN